MEKSMYYKDNNYVKTFYVINPSKGNKYGLGALIIETLKYIQYAELMDYIPVVDWRKDTQYSDESGKENAWNYFFKPLKGNDVEEISKNPNIYIIESKVSDLKNLDENRRISKNFNSDNLLKARKMFIDYFEFSDLVNERINEIEFDGLDTAGFYLRGTDYAVLKPHKHAIQPSVTLAIRKMNQVISKYGFSRILLVTEDKKIYDQVKHYYGRQLISLSFDRHINDYAGTDFLLDDMHSLNQLGENAKVRGLNYFIKLILLSKCECIVGGNTCGSWVSSVLSTSFKEKYIFNLGEYT